MRIGAMCAKWGRFTGSLGVKELTARIEVTSAGMPINHLNTGRDLVAYVQSLGVTSDDYARRMAARLQRPKKAFVDLLAPKNLDQCLPDWVARENQRGGLEVSMLAMKRRAAEVEEILTNYGPKNDKGVDHIGIIDLEEAEMPLCDEDMKSNTGLRNGVEEKYARKILIRDVFKTIKPDFLIIGNHEPATRVTIVDMELDDSHDAYLILRTEKADEFRTAGVLKVAKEVIQEIKKTLGIRIERT